MTELCFRYVANTHTKPGKEASKIAIDGRSGSTKLTPEANKLTSEANKLTHEANKLTHEADKLTSEAVNGWSGSGSTKLTPGRRNFKAS